MSSRKNQAPIGKREVHASLLANDADDEAE
jgi:hypothetical protein